MRTIEPKIENKGDKAMGGGQDKKRCVAYKELHSPGQNCFSAKHEAIKSPSHYTSGGIETISFIKAKLGKQFYSYCVGNCLKYLSRAGKKGDALEDLKKCQQYLEWAIREHSKED